MSLKLFLTGPLFLLQSHLQSSLPDSIQVSIRMHANDFSGGDLEVTLGQRCHSRSVSPGLNPDTLQVSNHLTHFEVVMF